MPVLSSLAQSLTGNPKKAVLTLWEFSYAAEGDLTSTASALASAALAVGASAAAASLNAGAARLEVQYNPASLSLRSDAQPVPFSALLDYHASNAVNQDSRPPETTLGVTLHFDDMNVKDAFQSDQFRLSAGDLVSDASALARTLTGRTYSVQSQTNALVALLMRKQTRYVTFGWADLSFTGEVAQVQARYTMFSPAGRPVRSQVELTLSQCLRGKADYTDWDKAFDKCFLDAPQGSGGDKPALLRAGSLVNITGF